MQVRQAAYLLDILRSAEAIQSYIEGHSREEFLRDTKTQDAVLRRILVIGEAATRLTPETMAEFGAIPFRKMAAMRNRVVHDYGQIDFEIVWEAATVHVAQVRTELATYFSTAGEAQIDEIP
jgi:uncharacterized protein with HEPN domain